MDAAYSFAENFCNIKFSDLPAEIVDATKKQIMDILGVMLGGSSKPGIKELVELLYEWGGKEDCSVFAFGKKLPAPYAGQANAAMGHALDFDDTGDGPTHPSVVIIPACLSMAEYAGTISGKEFITAAALGTDMMCRLGQAFRSGLKTPPKGGHPGAGWHLTTLYGYIASAGVASRILGLDKKKTVNAFGIAYHQCSGNGQCVTEGSLTKRMGPGFAVRGGISSAFMAKKGITGAESCLEGEVGLFNLYHHGEYDPKPLTKDLGKYFGGQSVSMKPYPCCKGTHTFVDVTLQMIRKHAIKPGDITEITIYCADDHYVLLYPIEKRSRPENAVDSQFSIPWATAAAVLRGKASIGDFTEEAIKNPELLEVSSKIRIKKDDSLADKKGMDYAKIGIRTKDGGYFIDETANLENSSENKSRSLLFEVYERKFRDCASYSIKPLHRDKTDQLVEYIKNLDKLDSIKKIIEILY